MEGVLALYDGVYHVTSPCLSFQSLFALGRSEWMRCFSVVLAIACCAAGDKLLVCLSKDLYALFGPKRKSVIVGPRRPNESNVAGMMRQSASWCRKTLSVISERDTASSAAERVFVPMKVVSIAIFVMLDFVCSLRVRRMSAGRLKGSVCVRPTGSKEIWFSLGMSCVMVAVVRMIVARQSRISLCAVLLLVHAMIWSPYASILLLFDVVAPVRV